MISLGADVVDVCARTGLGILLGDSKHEILYFFRLFLASGVFPFLRAIEFTGNQPAVPPVERVGCHNRGIPLNRFAQFLRFFGQLYALSVSEADALFDFGLIFGHYGEGAGIGC